MILHYFDDNVNNLLHPNAKKIRFIIKLRYHV